MTTYITHSAEETRKLAKKLAKKTSHGLIALTGPLGAGKTTFVQDFAQGLGIKQRIISPTFVLIRQHPIPQTNKVLYHIDLYRLEKASEFRELGLEELFSDQNAIVFIEWAEKVKNLLPKNTIYIDFKIMSKDVRKIKIAIPS